MICTSSLFSTGKRPQYPMNMRLFCATETVWTLGKERYSLSVPEMEARFLSFPGRRRLDIPTELLRICFKTGILLQL